MSEVIYPGITGGAGSFSLYTGHMPFKRSTMQETGLIQFQNGSEQRWQNRAVQGGFTLDFKDLCDIDRARIDNFIASVGGPEDFFTFSPSLGPDYSFSVTDCVLSQEPMTWTQSHEGFWDGSLKIRQYSVNGLSALNTTFAANPEVFASIGPGWNAGFPFTSTSRYMVDVADVQSGNRTSYNWMDKGFSNFPSRPLKSWTFQFSAITNAELLTLESHFLACAGRYHAFYYYDPDQRRTYYPVRYDMDSLDVVHTYYNVAQVTVKLAETFGPGWVA